MAEEEGTMRRGRRHGVGVIVSVLWLAGCAAGAPAGGPLWQEGPAGAVPAEIARLNDHLGQLAARLKPALVQVWVRRAQSPPAESPDPSRPTPPDEPRRASGSGFLIREDGLLVTNAHVVADAERIRVRLQDGRRFEGKLIGQDSRVDLAVVKIEGVRGLPVLPLGDSNRVRVGEFVLALGHPFGLEHTVSFGIVSRKGAPLRAAAPGFDFIQTDAGVNPGNSGGPLVNMAGEVVGVNSMASRNGSIGFAIPVNLVKSLLPQLVEKGKVEWGWLGVGIDEVSDEDLVTLGLKEARGVVIRRVMPGEPADKGGVKRNDVVLAVDGTSIDGPKDLQRIIATSPVGTTVKLTIVREGQETSLLVTVGRYQEPPARQETPARPRPHP
ncbi:MAG: trypsin-like peptidase domain-containing protein [Candidatus Rokubacteria bacterium]|nr:trypsin-like peptidase domain-containing protein [Candidatus Rokubacteria bacterium]